MAAREGSWHVTKDQSLIINRERVWLRSRHAGDRSSAGIVRSRENSCGNPRQPARGIIMRRGVRNWEGNRVGNRRKLSSGTVGESSGWRRDLKESSGNCKALVGISGNRLDLKEIAGSH